MVTIDGHKLEEAYGVELGRLKAKAIATKSDGNGGTLYTIPCSDIMNVITGCETKSIAQTVSQAKIARITAELKNMGGADATR
jgi:pyruvate/2-oxoglutarate dehydrogenase complex dihydrolipoamide acyltransferase (E2) component